MIVMKMMVASLSKGLIAFSLCVAWLCWPSTPTAPVDYPPAVGSPEYVMDQMGDECWTGKAPTNDIPSRVVYSDDENGAKVGGSAMVDKALNQLFNNQDSGLTIYGFCY